MTTMWPSPGEIAGRTAVGVCAVLFLGFVGMMLLTGDRPHEYLLFFGGLFAFGIGLLGALLLPLAFPSGGSPVALGVSLLVFVAILVVAAALLFR